MAPARFQRIALIASATLHVAILLVLGLVSFAIIMIGAMTCATAMAWELLAKPRRTANPHDHRPSIQDDPIDALA